MLVDAVNACNLWLSMECFFEGGASPLLLGMKLRTCATVPESDCGTAFSQQLVHRSVEFCMWRSIYQLKMFSVTAAGKVLIK